MRDQRRDADRRRPRRRCAPLRGDRQRRGAGDGGHAAPPGGRGTMSERARLPVVLLWHMHQPQYRDALSGQYVLPWTYLHAIKDYVDMAAHLEAAPAARAVVNFTPVLIEQLEEIGARIAQHLESGTALPDPVLALLGPAQV